MNATATEERFYTVKIYAADAREVAVLDYRRTEPTREQIEAKTRHYGGASASLVVSTYARGVIAVYGYAAPAVVEVRCCHPRHPQARHTPRRDCVNPR